jgi:hypothetical protein
MGESPHFYASFLLFVYTPTFPPELLTSIIVLFATT